MRPDSPRSWALLLAAEVALAACLVIMTPLVPIAALAVVAGLVAIVFMPRWVGAAAVILVLPAYDYSFFSVGAESGVGFLEVGLLIALVKWAFDGVRERRLVFEIGEFGVPVLLLLGFGLMTLLWVPSLVRGLHQAAKIVTGFAIYFTMLNLIRDRRDFERALTTWVLLSVVVAVSAFIYVQARSIPATAALEIPQGEVPALGKVVRVTLFFRQPNGLAFFLSISALFAIIRYYWGRSILGKVFHAGAIVVMLLVLAATFSRKSWLGIALGVGIVGLRYPRLLVEATLAVLAALLVLFLSDTGNFSEALWQRVLSLFFDPEVSIAERWVAWDVGFQLFQKSPLVGNGIGSFWILSWRLGSPLLMPHNFYVYLLAETGLIGVSLFAILAVHIAWTLWIKMVRITDPYTNFLATLFLGCWLSILFQAAFKTIGLTEPLFWGFIALSASFVRLTAEEGQAALPRKPEEDESAPVVRTVVVA
jgi:O-antigen ligase